MFASLKLAIWKQPHFKALNILSNVRNFDVIFTGLYVMINGRKSQKEFTERFLHFCYINCVLSLQAFIYF